MATIEQRLEQLEASTKHLEKSQKRYRFATIGLLCLLCLGGAGVSMGQTSSDIVDVLKCRKLEVVGLRTGEPAITLTQNSNGGMMLLNSVNEENKGFVIVAMTRSGGLIRTVSAKGKKACDIDIDDESNGYIGVYSDEGKERVYDSQ